jgi:leader peptidase (prepilin peptidase)/N-methyltransferase
MLTPAALGILYLLAVAWPLAKTDFKEHRLPNRLVLPAFGVTLVGQLAALLLGDEMQKLWQALSISLLVFSLGLLMNRYAGLGMGDVKLLAAMALSLGWFSGELVFYSVLLASVLATLAVVWLRIRNKATASQAIALGPYLLLGYLAVSFTQLQ